MKSDMVQQQGWNWKTLLQVKQAKRQTLCEFINAEGRGEVRLRWRAGVVWARVVDFSEPSKQSKCEEQAEAGVGKDSETLTHANLAVYFKGTS